MESSSRDTISKAFEEIIQWKKKHGTRTRKMRRRKRNYVFEDEGVHHWSESHLSVVHTFVLKLHISSNLKLLSTAKYFNTLWRGMPGSCTIYPKIVMSFIHELQELFVVPTPQQIFKRDNILRKNEILSAFISFLLELLYHKTEFTEPFKDQIQSLEKDMRFLVLVLEDTLLVCDEHEQVNNLLLEFEEVANEAATLLHSFFFSVDLQFEPVAASLVLILSHIDILKADIINFLTLPPFTAKVNSTPNTAVVDSLFIVDSLLSDLKEILNRDNQMDQIKILHKELMYAESFLKGISWVEMDELKEAVIRLRDVAYEAEYLINTFLVGDAHIWYFSIRLTHVIDKIKLLGKELQTRNHDINGGLEVAENFRKQLSLQTMRDSEVDDEVTVGLEDKETCILDQMLGGTKKLQIISIFGMPGLGKTTLAKKLYDHPSTMYRFDKRSWCVVHPTYQRKSVLIDILISLTSEANEGHELLNMDEESLVERIYKSLIGRRYVIVMDDIWDSNAWDDLQRCFPDDGNGSRVLMTSRNKDVAPPNSIPYALPPLSNDQCWELLEKKVFRNKHCPIELRYTGKKIAANCNGLPLAVVVIAGFLSGVDKKERRTWETVERNLTSYIFDGKDNHVMQILELSYKNLASHLKPCFLYFGAFAKGTEIPVRKLMRLWIAERFILHNPESIAEEYLQELIDKSLVVVSKRRSDGGVKACIIHDLLRDLCLRKAEEEKFLKSNENNNSLYTKHHRLCVNKSPVSKAWTQFWLPFGLHTRSLFLSLPCSSLHLPNMKLLRVLDLQNTRLSSGEVDGIELLLQLRYLAMTFMPSAIGSLVNLEFLIVETSYIVFIPAAIFKLTKLRCLHVTDQGIFGENCYSSQVNSLKYLSNVRIYELMDEEVLKLSPTLRKLKCICRLLCVFKEASRYPDFRFFTQLESLKISCYYWLKHKKTVKLNLPSSIKKLTLSSFHFPWKMMSMVRGLPNLQVLKLKNDAFVGEIWNTRDGKFQQLRFLKLEGLRLVEWNMASSQCFPKLQRLALRNCFYLREIPSEVGDIPTLQLIEVHGFCKESVKESAVQIQQEQRDMGNEELRVLIGH